MVSHSTLILDRVYYRLQPDDREGKDRKTKYFFADPSVVVAPPEKSIALPTEDVCFSLDSDQLASMKASPSINCLICVLLVGMCGQTVARDKKNILLMSINQCRTTDVEFHSTQG